MSQNLADDLYGHIVLDCPSRKSVTNSVKMVERYFRILDDSHVHLAEVVRFNQTAEFVGENISVIVVGSAQPLLLKKLTGSVNKELLQHRVGKRNNTVTLLGFGCALNDSL